jgi:hypothetical protein
MLNPNHCNRSIHTADDAAEEILAASLVAAYGLQGLWLQLVALIGKPLHNLPALGWSALDGLGGYLQHRKEYKNVPTDKCG